MRRTRFILMDNGLDIRMASLQVSLELYSRDGRTHLRVSRLFSNCVRASICTGWEDVNRMPVHIDVIN